MQPRRKASPYVAEMRLIAVERGIAGRPRILAEGERVTGTSAGGVGRNVVAEAPSLRAQHHSGRVRRAGGDGREAGEVRKGREEVEEFHIILDDLSRRVPGIEDDEGDSRLLLEVALLGEFAALAERPSVVADDGDDGAVALHLGQDVADETVDVSHGREVVLPDQSEQSRKMTKYCESRSHTTNVGKYFSHQK